MDVGDGFGDDDPSAGWVSPDDRLWRHPSEVALVAPRPRRFEPRLWTVAVLAGVIASLLTSALIVAAGGFRKTVRPTELLAPASASIASADRSATHVELIAEHLRPSIVQVEVQTSLGKARGSGVIFRTDGHILTNQHLIEGAQTIKIILADGREAKADLIGSDPETDVAVLKVDNLDAPPAALGSATHLKVGQMAIAIGEPLGRAGGPTVTLGVVSAIGRQVSNGAGSLLDMIQTDAPIAPGSSGGALVDGAGAVIGITTAIAVTEIGSEGLGFATPIDIARDVAEQLITSGRVVHVWLGIEGEDLDTARAEVMKVPGGAVVKGVKGDSPASVAGLSASDVITSLDGKAVISMAGLVVALRARKPGEVVKLVVWREGGGTRTVTATLAERPATVK